MSALDGKVQRRVIRGERNVQFEVIPSFRSSLTWSPQGDRLALTAKSAGKDVLYIVEVANGKVLRRLTLPCDALYYPAWSPNSDSIAVVGVKDGRSDLWMVDARSGALSRLTDDTHDEKEPTWTPDGRRLTFASDRLAPVVLHPVRRVHEFGGYGIFDLELASGRVSKVLDTYGDDHAPAWSPDGRRLAFVSDRSGAPNIFLYDPADSSFTQLTEVLGGVSSLSWSRLDDRLVFSAFNRGGWDVFAVKEPLSLDGVLARLRRKAPESVLTPLQAQQSGADTVRSARRPAALAASWPDSVTAVADSSLAIDARGEPFDFARGDTTGMRPPRDDEPPPWSGGFARPFPVIRDTTPAIVSTVPLVERGGPFAVPDSVLGQEPQRYKVRLAPDYAGGGFYASSGFGFVGSTQFVFSDFLGDHNLYVATDVFSNSLEETNALAVYNYLPRRWDYGLGLFHFKNYFSSRVTTLGEQFGSPRLFSERNFGAILSSSYPFDRFRRMELNYTQMFVERTFFEEDAIGNLFEAGKEYRSVHSPSVSLVGDNSLFGQYGPVNGARYNLTYSPAIHWFSHGLSYQTVTVDARRYWDLTHGYTFAGRFLGGYSTGRDAADVPGRRVLDAAWILRFRPAVGTARDRERRAALPVHPAARTGGTGAGRDLQPAGRRVRRLRCAVERGRQAPDHRGGTVGTAAGARRAARWAIHGRRIRLRRRHPHRGLLLPPQARCGLGDRPRSREPAPLALQHRTRVLEVRR